LKVRMVKTAARAEGTWMSGRVYDIEDGLAMQFVTARAAIPLEPVIEAEAIEPKERAVLPKSKQKGGKKR